MKQLEFLITMYFFGAISSLCPAQTTRTNSVSTNALVNESWNSISNRWGAVPFVQVKQAAEHGDAIAKYYLADSFFNGSGVAKDQSEGLKWIKSASDQGYANAQMYLGWMYEDGDGIPQDYAIAAKLFRLAAGQGNARAQNNLGDLYQHGKGVPEDFSEAVNWFRKSAEQGDELGQCNLGWMYGHGQGVECNYELAEKWMRLAAEQGTARLQFLYAEMLNSEFDKQGHQIANYVVAAEWYRKAADQGYAKALYELAELYNYGKLGDDQRSNCIPWYLKAAAQGNVKAQAAVGELSRSYPNSELLKNTDIVKTLEQSAATGYFYAQFQLAKRYQTGDGVPKNATEAFKWMQKASQCETQDGRVAEAIYCLALMYEKGEGVSQDLSAAHRLFIQAVEYNRQPDAAFRVGQMYEKGDGVTQDDRKATEFYANEFHVHSQKYPNGVIHYLTPGDGAIESLLHLWAMGRGLPNEQDKLTPGYREPDALINFWVRHIKTAKAEFYAGEIFYQGKLVSKDMAQAADWFNKAAELGSAEAMNRIGQMWASGMNGAPDSKEAANWYHKAASLRAAEAQYNLGLCYAKGEGVPVNPVEAWKWLQLAAEQKFHNAAEERDKINTTMTEAQVQEARTLANQINAITNNESSN